ncbi:GGDEF domain-containing protein [Thermodesulfobacteriota bacterium]
MKRIINFSGFKVKGKKNLTEQAPKKGTKKTHEPFFVQALLEPKKNELFYVMDSCVELLNTSTLKDFYDKVLIELQKSLHSKKSALYIYEKKNNSYEMIDHNGFSEAESNKWDKLSESIKSELKVNNNSFFGISNDMKVDINSLIIPIYNNDVLHAVVKLSDREAFGKFSKYDINIANQILNFINIALCNLLAPKKEDGVSDNTLRLHEERTLKLNYFYEFISSELRRSRRYKKTFSLIFFTIENYDELIDKFEKDTIDRHINSILDKLNATIRETDFIAEESETKYFILLPETDYFGSLITMRKVDANINEILHIKSGDKKATISTQMSSASFPKDGTNARNLLKTLSLRLEVSKDSIAEKMNIKDAGFWELLSKLIGDESDYSEEAIKEKNNSMTNLENGEKDEKGLIKFAVFKPQTLKQLESAIFHEISINKERKGIIYIGCDDINQTFNAIKKLPDLEYSKSRISLITKQCEKDVMFPNITYIFTTDEVISDSYFLVYLNEMYAYGMFAKKDSNGDYCGFHTSDSIFVENLIVKLQNHYMLQEKL